MKKIFFLIILASIIAYFTIKTMTKTTIKPVSLLPITQPEITGASSAKLNEIDSLVQQAITEQKLPGAVILIGYKGSIIYKKAFGNRMLTPKNRLMTPDTIFDVASLTKPIITATAILQLIEQKKLALDDVVAHFIPDFARDGKEEITIQQLLTHRSGLPAVTDLHYYQDGSEHLNDHLCNLILKHKPGTTYLYSDIGYIILGIIIEQITQTPLKVYAKQAILRPLQMQHSYFNPHPILWPLIAPHETDEKGNIIHGRVHDPRAFFMEGHAGHAGLFSTADDLAIFCQMLLNKGMYHEQRFLEERSIELLTRALPTFPRGSHFSAQSFGHTGFTGVSLWIDPTKKMFVIFLSNQLHPEGKTLTKDLRYQVSTIAAQAINE